MRKKIMSKILIFNKLFRSEVAKLEVAFINESMPSFVLMSPCASGESVFRFFQKWIRSRKVWKPLI